MEKYYTPTIEELHIGFECEILGITNNEEVWARHIINQEVLNMAPTGIVRLNKSWRVKILDQEDIEKCGWGNYEAPREYNHRWTRGSKTLDVWFNSEIPTVRIRIDLIIVFHGKIRNLSEFKTLQKQLELT